MNISLLSLVANTILTDVTSTRLWRIKINVKFSFMFLFMQDCNRTKSKANDVEFFIEADKETALVICEQSCPCITISEWFWSSYPSLFFFLKLFSGSTSHPFLLVIFNFKVSLLFLICVRTHACIPHQNMGKKACKCKNELNGGGWDGPHQVWDQIGP